MAGTLIDPSKPAGAVVGETDEGRPLRNDGIDLTPANENPWYVLATVFGEQENSAPSDDLHDRNRRIWNGWACRNMTGSARADMARELELDPGDLAPLSGAERATAEKALRARLPNVVIARLDLDDFLRGPDAEIDMRETHFVSTVLFSKCVFSANTYFHSAAFRADADFRSAIFKSHAIFDYAAFYPDVYFHSAIFCANVSFNSTTVGAFADFHSTTFGAFASLHSATFRGYADLGSATFQANADFRSVTFRNDADFRSASFSASADFGSATFETEADFSNGSFAGRTTFEGAQFLSSVPKFFQRGMHQDTTFSTCPSTLDKTFWPVVSEDIAKEGKQAYTRLRQLMNELHKSDDEHFFFRQEMRCKAVLEEGLSRQVIRAFGFVSDYGNSVERPLYGLIAVWFLPMILFMAAFNFTCASSGDQCYAPLAPLGLSFGNLFSFLGLNRLYFSDVVTQMHWSLQAVAGLQTVLGFVLLFFFGLGLRNHFRLK